MPHDTHDLKKDVKKYTNIGITLLVLTVVTVLVSYFHLPLFWAVLVALIIAAFKSSLVASFFMHLVGERPMIGYIVILAGTLFASMIFLLIVSDKDKIRGTEMLHYESGIKAEPGHGDHAAQ